MRPRIEPELVALAARLEVANAAARGARLDGARPEQDKRSQRTPAAVGLPAQNSHMRAYLGAGAVILGLLFLLLLDQVSF